MISLWLRVWYAQEYLGATSSVPTTAITFFFFVRANAFVSSGWRSQNLNLLTQTESEGAIDLAFKSF
uniref:Uncharacterized protein n=1 Tax=Chromera velia CCMP2878 TaxID=1169474 RepID=A0A0G4G3R2_9ALVE|eukprot:Cvel_20094.t1-p1 / transcript=Cvel_20094.t1 / gene=Cvel_20094 / organism=Chromera_velia_CCMP2878 / gene_product=hypothetical protein / transcript_product=hypothetical protein / location=Cvel_scaffold1779:19887-20084(+) / protein_length=66 / sequence_SO=supercontig / SO=protein_coding / is_pseudo=false